MLYRHVSRVLAAVTTAAALTLTACSTGDEAPRTEAAVGLPVDAARVTVQSPGAAERVLEYAATGEQSVSVEVAEGFSQVLMRADAVDVTAPAGGDVTRLTLPLQGSTDSAADPAEEERPATRDVEFRVGEPSPDDLALLDDARSTEGFLLGWRGDDSGQVSTVRLAAPTQATDEGRALTEQALMKLLSLPVIFPAEEIGVGATWSVDTRVTGESTLLQTATYTITSLTGDRVELNVDVQQRPALGALTMEDGSTLRVLNSNTTSEGTLTVDLGSPLPVGGQVAYTTRVVYGGDSDVRVVQDSTTSLAFS